MYIRSCQVAYNYIQVKMFQRWPKTRLNTVPPPLTSAHKGHTLCSFYWCHPCEFSIQSILSSLNSSSNLCRPKVFLGLKVSGFGNCSRKILLALYWKPSIPNFWVFCMEVKKSQPPADVKINDCCEYLDIAVSFHDRRIPHRMKKWFEVAS